MAAVSETIVREYFELHGFFVRQQRKYIAPTRREDEEIDFFVLNPRHVAAGQPLPFVLTSEDLHGSKPYGPPGDPRTSGEVPTRFAPRASPSPSPRPSPPPRGRGCPEGGRGGRFMGRENPPLACTTPRGVCPTNFPNNRTCRRLFPLPVGGSG